MNYSRRTLSSSFMALGAAGALALSAAPALAATGTSSTAAVKATASSFLRDVYTNNQAACRLMSAHYRHELNIGQQVPGVDSCLNAIYSVSGLPFAWSGGSATALRAQLSAALAGAQASVKGVAASVKMQNQDFDGAAGVSTLALVRQHGRWLVNGLSSHQTPQSRAVSDLEQEEAVSYKAAKAASVSNPNQRYDTGKALVKDIVDSEPELTGYLSAARDPGVKHAKANVLYVGASTPRTFTAVAYTPHGVQVRYAVAADGVLAVTVTPAKKS